MQPISTALIGFGKSGEWLHAPFIDTLPEFIFSKIAARSGDRAMQLYPDTMLVRTPEEVVADPSVELVVIVTPNDTHADFAAKALRTGKHVVIDKPFTVTASEARFIAALSEETGKKVFVYQNRRWDSDFLTVQKILKEGILGTIESIESRMDRYRPEPRTTYWKESEVPGNGLWYDIGPHLLDQAMTLYGEPQKVEADIKIQRPNARGIDYMDVLLHYPGIKYRIHADMMQEIPTPRWKITGSTGTYIKYGMDPQEALLSKGEKPLGDQWGAEAEEQFGRIVFTDGSSKVYPSEQGDWRNFYRSVYNSIRKDEPFPFSIQSSVRLIEWIEKLSIETSKV